MKAKGGSWEISEVSGIIQQVLAKLATVQTRSSRMLPFKGKNNQIYSAQHLPYMLLYVYLLYVTTFGSENITHKGRVCFLIHVPCLTQVYLQKRDLSTLHLHQLYQPTQGSYSFHSRCPIQLSMKVQPTSQISGVLDYVRNKLGGEF